MKQRFLLIGIFLLGLNSIQAQNNLTLYHMKSLPQSLYVNPGHQIDYRFFMGIPALSSWNVNLNTRNLSVSMLNNALVENANGQVSLDLKEITRNSDGPALISSDLGIDLIHFGFKIRKTRITFNATEMIQTRIGLPLDILAFAIEGNGGDNLGREFNFAPAFDFRHYREYAIGLQRQFLNDRLSVGIRPKFLVGFSNIETYKNKFSLTTDAEDYTWTLRSDIGINASTSFGDLNDAENFSINPADWSARRIALGSNSRGAGLDVGATFDLTKKITISASVINLGFIKWNDNPLNIQSRDPNATLIFKGVDVNQWIENDSFNTDILMDSVLNFVNNFDSTQNSFTNFLFPNFYLGASFNLTKKHGFGVLMYGSYYNRMFNPALTLSYNGQIRNNLGISVSYSAIRGSLVNVGGGIFLKGGPLQTYIVVDNILQGGGGLDNFSMRVGTQFLLLKDKKKRKKKKTKTLSE